MCQAYNTCCVKKKHTFDYCALTVRAWFNRWGTKRPISPWRCTFAAARLTPCSRSVGCCSRTSFPYYSFRTLSFMSWGKEATRPFFLIVLKLNLRGTAETKRYFQCTHVRPPFHILYGKASRLKSGSRESLPSTSSAPQCLCMGQLSLAPKLIMCFVSVQQKKNREEENNKIKLANAFSDTMCSR